MRCGKAHDRVDTCLETLVLRCPSWPPLLWGVGTGTRLVLQRGGPGAGEWPGGCQVGTRPPAPLPLSRPLLPSCASPLRHPPVPGSGSSAVSGVLPFLICKFKMCLQSIFHPRPSLPPRLRAASLGAGLSPRRGAQVSIATGFLMPVSSEVPCSDWGIPALHPRALLTHWWPGEAFKSQA